MPKTLSKSVPAAPIAAPEASKPAPRARKRVAKPVVIVPPVETPPLEATLADKAKKPKLVRDSFTIPKGEYAVLDALKQRAAALAQPAKKSEVLRAGIKALAALSDEAFLAALRDVPAIKTGRPESAEPKAKAKD
jgi:hypothetical protein